MAHFNVSIIVKDIAYKLQWIFVVRGNYAN